MLVIRLTRVGATNDRKFRILIQEKRRSPKGPFIEVIGSYNPTTKPFTFEINKERYEHWLKQGAQPSDTIASLVAYKPENAKKKTPKKTKKQKAKIVAELEAKTKADEEAKAKAEAEKAAPKEAPATEAKAEEPKAEEAKPAEAPKA